MRNEKCVLPLPERSLPEMRERLALLNAAIAALEEYAGGMSQGEPGGRNESMVAAGIALRPFLVARRDPSSQAEKAS